MQESDRAEFGKLLFTAAEIAERDLSESAVELYWRLLAKYDYADVERAIHAHLMNPDTGQFFLKPADIEKAIQGDTKSQALVAWTEVKTAIGSIGSYESVVFGDERTQAVIADMGGWVQLCQTAESEVPFRAQEFQKRYQAYTANAPIKWPSHLVGLIEQQNGMRGGRIAPPRAIGTIEAARRVYLSAGGDPSREPCGPARPPYIEQERPLPAITDEKATENRRQVGNLIAAAMPTRAPTLAELRAKLNAPGTVAARRAETDKAQRDAERAAAEADIARRQAERELESEPAERATA